MEFQKVLETRRSVRKYDPNVSVTREQMEELIRAAQEAPSWKNSQTGRYYCVLSEEIADKIRETCLPQARNAEKSKHAALIISTFVHTAPVSKRTALHRKMKSEMDGDATTLVCRTQT